MTAPKKHWYLIAYDVRDPRRLRRVHAYLRKEATAIQESVFAIESDAPRLAEIERELRARTHPNEDDLRLYAIPGPAAVWAAGAQTQRVAGMYSADAGHAKGAGQGIAARLRGWVRGLMGEQAA